MRANCFEGRIWIFGDNIDTDLIYPVTYFFSTEGGITDPEEIKKHPMAGIDPDFVNTIQSGDIVVAGKNFGCGSHREQAVTSLKYAGISLIIAKSFSRIYYRNAVNLGMPLAEWADDEIPEMVPGDILSVDLEKGLAVNKTLNKKICLKPIPPMVLNIIQAGGLTEVAKKKGITQWWQTTA